VVRWIFQLGILLFVVSVLYWLWNNYQLNVAQSRIPTNFRFLDNPASFTMPGNALDQSAPVRRAFVQGFYNTLRVSIVGILLALLLGTLVGIGRLSKNFVVRTVTGAYVEILRNLPLLLLLTFMNLAVVLQFFPRIESAWVPLDLFVISNRGIAIPWFVGSGKTLLVVLGIGVIAAFAVSTGCKRYSNRTGKPVRTLLYAGLVLLFLVVAGWSSFGYRWTLPIVDDRGSLGGIRVDPSYFALLISLVLYTSSHVAEIVRGSILAVPKGQGEAADAIALSPGRKMQLIILPQAFRVAMPALGNQSLNLIKNSSLGAAISYFELTQIAQVTVGNGSPAVPAFTLTLVVYLTISLTSSLIINIFNRRLALVER
jgi:general L-amino acid transport system permease protein